MSSRDEILQAIRAHRHEAVPLPSLDEGPWITFDDLRQQLIDVTEAVGGQALVVDGIDQINRALEGLEPYRAARQICTLVPGAGQGTVDPQAIADPHDLASLDLVIAPGEFAVAENGAVWVTEQAAGHRSLYFIAEHMVLVVLAAAIVPHMHAAYARLTWDDGGFGGFISGPSKTADIEQSLVIGAQGPRSLTLLLNCQTNDDGEGRR
jgi:L-lactate dehydrogenase complex protein LldG